MPMIACLNPDKDLREERSRDHGELSQTKRRETRRFRQVLKTRNQVVTSRALPSKTRLNSHFVRQKLLTVVFHHFYNN